MAGAVSELRARFSAQISNFRSAVSDVRQEISGIGDNSRRSVQEANRSFDGMRGSLSSLRLAMQDAGAGTSRIFDGLESAVDRAESDLSTFGRISVATMVDLQRAVDRAGNTLDELGDDVDLGGLDQEIRNMDSAIEQFGRNATGSTREAEKALNNYKKSMTTVITVAGLAGTAIVAGMTGAITFSEDYQRSLNSLQSQTGATDDETKALGESMKNIYASNLGQDFTDIADSMALVRQNTGLTGKELESTSKSAILLRDTMQMDVMESTKVADTMMKQFGISADEAFTLFAQGQQAGLNKSGDMLDTFNEYSVYFKQLGFDSEGMWNVINAGMSAGAFNSDKVGDAIKELGIRVKDGSKTTNEAFADLGLNADETAQAFAKGGESSQKALGTIFSELAKIEDPVKRNAIGVNLFGTQFEDLEYKTIQAMGSVRNEADMTGDTLDKINEVQYSTMTEALRGIGRTIAVEVIEPIQTKVMPTVNKFINEFKKNLPTIKDAFSTAFNAIIDTVSKFAPTFESLFIIFKNASGWVGSTLVVAFTALGSILAPIVNTITSIVAKFTEWEGFIPVLNGIIAGFLTYKTYILAMQAPMLLQIARTKALTLATKAMNIVMKMNPIGLVIAALVGLGVALYTAYKKSETFRNIVNGAWEAIKNGAKAVFEWLTTNIPIWIDNIVQAWKDFKEGVVGIWDWLKSFFGKWGTEIVQAWDSFKNGIISLWDWVKNFFAKWGVEILAVIAPFIGIPLLIAKHWDTIKSFLVNLWNSILSVVMPIINNFVSIAKQLFTNFVNNTKGIVTPIKDFFVNTWQNIKLLVLSIVSVFLNLITGNFEDLKISLLGIWTAIKNQVVNIVKTLKDVALAVFKLFWTGVTTGFNTLKTGVVKIVTTLKTTAVNIFNTLKSGLINAANAIKTGVINTINNLKNGFVNSVNAIKTGAVNAFNTLKNGAINSVKALKNGTVSAIKSAKTTFVNTVNAIKNGVTSGFNTAKNTAINAVNGMKNSISNGISRIKGFFTNMKSNIISTVKGIDLLQIGKDIVNGLINGISSKIKKVKDTMTNLADSVTGKVKSLLGIHSPSRVFRDFGNFIGEGLAIGIDKSRKLVASASQMLAESAKIEPDTNGIGELTGETIGNQINLDDPDNEGGGGTHTTNYDAPLMNVENLYVNDKDDAREVSNGLYRLQQDHDRARGKKTS